MDPCGNYILNIFHGNKLKYINQISKKQKLNDCLNRFLIILILDASELKRYEVALANLGITLNITHRNLLQNL